MGEAETISEVVRNNEKRADRHKTRVTSRGTVARFVVKRSAETREHASKKRGEVGYDCLPLDEARRGDSIRECHPSMLRASRVEGEEGKARQRELQSCRRQTKESSV